MNFQSSFQTSNPLGAELFLKRNAKKIKAALEAGKIEEVLDLSKHPHFVWPQEGTRILARYNYFRSAEKMFAFMKYNQLRGFEWHEETIFTLIKYNRQHFLELVCQNGCPVTRDHVIKAVEKGNAHMFDTLVQYVLYDVRADLDLQLFAIRSHQPQMLYHLRKLQYKYHPVALHAIIKEGQHTMFENVLCFEKSLKPESEWLLTAIKSTSVVDHIVSANEARMLEYCLPFGFSFTNNIMYYALAHDSKEVVKMLITQPLTVKLGLEYQTRILFGWQTDYLAIAASHNAFRTMKWLMEYGLRTMNVPPEFLWPKHTLAECINTEMRIRTSAMTPDKSKTSILLRQLNDFPLGCMQFAYENGAYAYPDFLNKLQDLIQTYEIHLLNPRKEWIARLTSNPIFQIMSLIPVKKASEEKPSQVEKASE